MAEHTRPPLLVRFGAFELDLRAGELRKQGRRLKLHGQPIEVLAMLLEHPGEVVAREELQKKLWPTDTFVDFDHSLNTAINKLRETLGDSAENPRFVETVPRRGYRFIATVDGLERPPKPRIAARYWWLAGIGLAGLVAVLVGLNVAGLRDRLLGTAPSLPIQSIAVLPLENLSGDPEQEYFADGMTDALITNLGKIGALRVISRTSVMHYKEARKTLPEIARELNVEAVVEGSVLRAGHRVRITTQLIHAATDEQLWGGSYERDLRDVLALQSEVARAIAREIEITVGAEERARLVVTRPINAEAHDAYLKGRYFWGKRGKENLETALKYFHQAIEAEASFAPAYTGLADSLMVLAGMRGVRHRELEQKASAAAMKAVELDDMLAEAHTSLGAVLMDHEWDWSGAEREFRRALELNPGYATGRHWYGWFLSRMGRHDEAIAEMKRALELDPFSHVINANLGQVYLNARQYGKAVEQGQRTIELGNPFGHHCVAMAYEGTRRYEEAIAELKKGFPRDHPHLVADLGYVYAVSGRRGEALKMLEELKEISKHRPVPPNFFAWVYTGLGDTDRALQWLEKGYEERERLLVELKVLRWFDRLRFDPRFQDLLRRMNFPE